MNKFINSLFSIFVTSSEFLALYITVLVVALLFGATITRRIFGENRQDYLRRAIIVIAVALISTIALIYFQDKFIHTYPHDDRCPNDAFSTVYLPLFQSEEVRKAAYIFPFSQKTTCDDLIELILASATGWTRYLTIGIQLFLAWVLIASLTVLITQIGRTVEKQ